MLMSQIKNLWKRRQISNSCFIQMRRICVSNNTDGWMRAWARRLVPWNRVTFYNGKADSILILIQRSKNNMGFEESRAVMITGWYEWKVRFSLICVHRTYTGLYIEVGYNSYILTRRRNLQFSWPVEQRSSPARTGVCAAFLQSPPRFVPTRPEGGSLERPVEGAATGRWLPGWHRRDGPASASHRPSAARGSGHGRWTCGDPHAFARRGCSRTCVWRAVWWRKAV